MVWANSQFATVWVLCLLGFRSYLWTEFDDLYVIRRFSTQGCAFWGFSWNCSPYRGSKSPQINFWGVSRHFPAKLAKYSNFIITTTTRWIATKICPVIKDLQVLSVGDPKMCPTNRRWWTATPSLKIDISPQPFDWLTKYGKGMRVPLHTTGL